MTTQRTTPLRERMREEMRLRNYSPRSEEVYLFHVRRFAEHFRKSPDLLGESEIRSYLMELRHRGMSQSSFKQAVAALRFFYRHTLRQDWLTERIPYPRKQKTLPVVLTQAEVKKIFEHVSNERYRKVLETIYAAGLRLSEALALRIEDIDSKQMTLRIRLGKGQEERHAMLSPQLLERLRSYYKRHRPREWMFERSTGRHFEESSIQRAFKQALKKAGINKRASPSPIPGSALSQTTPSLSLTAITARWSRKT